jgi:hypothetical protein
VNRPISARSFSPPPNSKKVSCLISVTYTLIYDVCFSDENRQQRTGSCSIIYRNLWNYTSSQATTQYISTIWDTVASSAYCQRHGTGTPGMISVRTASDLVDCVKDRRSRTRGISVLSGLKLLLIICERKRRRLFLHIKPPGACVMFINLFRSTG